MNITGTIEARFNDVELYKAYIASEAERKVQLKQLAEDLIVGQLQRDGLWLHAQMLGEINKGSSIEQVRKVAGDMLDDLINAAMDKLGFPKAETEPKYIWRNGAKVKAK